MNLLWYLEERGAKSVCVPLNKKTKKTIAYFYFVQSFFGPLYFIVDVKDKLSNIIFLKIFSDNGAN